MILDDKEISAITKVKCRKRLLRYQRQREALTLMGIDHVVRPDGSLLVSRAHVEHLLSGGDKRTITPKETEPNWSAM